MRQTFLKMSRLFMLLVVSSILFRDLQKNKVIARLSSIRSVKQSHKIRRALPVLGNIMKKFKKGLTGTWLPFRLNKVMKIRSLWE